MRLSSGGDYERDDQLSSTDYARILFLRAVFKCKPEVWDDLLKGTAGRLYAKLVIREEMFLPYTKLKEDLSTSPIADALDAWGKQWHLEDDWCKELGLKFIEESLYPIADDAAEGWVFLPSRGTITSLEEHSFIFEHEFRDLTQQTRKELEDEIRSAFEADLESYLDYVKDIAKKRGYVPVPKKADDIHFEMLARYQVLGCTHEEIRGEYSYKESGSIAHILSNTAKLINLTRRKGRGRPRKAR